MKITINVRDLSNLNRLTNNLEERINCFDSGGGFEVRTIKLGDKVLCESGIRKTKAGFIIDEFKLED